MLDLEKKILRLQKQTRTASFGKASIDKPNSFSRKSFSPQLVRQMQLLQHTRRKRTFCTFCVLQMARHVWMAGQLCKMYNFTLQSLKMVWVVLKTEFQLSKLLKTHLLLFGGISTSCQLAPIKFIRKRSLQSSSTFEENPTLTLN